MTKRMRFMALALSGVLAVSSLLTACGSNERGGESETTTGTAEASTASTEDGETAVAEEEKADGPIITEPVTISVLTTRHSNATNEADDLWFFHYMEYWLAEQGYDVTFDVQQSYEIQQQLSLMLGSDTLPDLVWGTPLSKADILTYGAEEGMLLDWMPYLNEETMPNVMKIFQANENEYESDICPVNGAVYGLPYINTRGYLMATGNYGDAHRVYIDQKWLDECGLEVPETLDDFLDMLRAFKNVKTASGEAAIPVVSNAEFLEKYLWICLGYYGTSLTGYGTGMTIKDDQIVLPAYSEDYRTFIEIMNTLYTEGLISPDHFTMDTTTARGLTSSGVAGVICDYGLQYLPEGEFANMVSAKPLLIGDNDQIAVSAMSAYQGGHIWASSKTKYPELLAMILNYIYSDEGSTYYFCGPMEGQDPLGMVDGWYYNKDGQITTKLVEDGTFADFTLYTWQYIMPTKYAGNDSVHAAYSRKIAGLEDITEDYVYTDSITGKDVTIVKDKEYSENDVDGKWRIITAEAWEPYATLVRLPEPWMSEEDALRATEIETVIQPYILSESAKFVTGIRPLSELDDYFEELKAMDVEEYISLQKEAYATYMDSVYN